MRTLRIFISSPGDVAEERQIAGKVIERLQGKYWSFVRLDDVFWEQKVVRSTAHYQDELINPGDCEMVVGILWSRLGSPLPEKFRKQTGERYQSGTEWELEVAFDAYEKSLAETGNPVTAKPDIIIYRRKGIPTAREDEKLNPRHAGQIEKLDAYLKQNYLFPDGTIKRPITGYTSLEEFERKLALNLEELILRHIPGLKPGFEPPPISGSPFKGLQAFSFRDSDRYFGRNREIREIQQQLVNSARKGMPFLLIYGGSGYGKSSLMRAGLAPVLTRPGGSLDDIAGWRRVSFQPAIGEGPLVERFVRTLLQPTDPDEVKEAQLHPHWPLTGLAELGGKTIEGIFWDQASLIRSLSDDERRIFAIAAITQTLEVLNRHLLLEIDQLEELFTTPGFEGAPRSTFLKIIGDLCATGRVWTVATMRSEFFPRVAEEPELFLLVGKDRGFILPPPDPQSLREIIRYPALAARLDFERRVEDFEIAGERAKHDYLHDQILADAESSPDALPLLEFTLQQLYDERDQDKNLLTWKSYANAGGLKGAIARRATETYQSLNPVAREARHYIFAAIVNVDPAVGTVTRQQASLPSLRAGDAGRAFTDAFTAARLFVTDEDVGAATITLAHEALITHWADLAGWVDLHKRDLQALRRLRDATNLWLENGETSSHLLSEGRLAEADEAESTGIANLTPDELRFLRLSRNRARRKRNLLKVGAAVFAILAIATSIAGLSAKKSGDLAKDRQQEAEAAKEAAEDSAKVARRMLGATYHRQAVDFYDRSDEENLTKQKALAFLCAALKEDPENASARALLLSTLKNDPWLVPVAVIPYPDANPEFSSAAAPEGDWALVLGPDHFQRVDHNGTTAPPVPLPLLKKGHTRRISHLFADIGRIIVTDVRSGTEGEEPSEQHHTVIAIANGSVIHDFRTLSMTGHYCVAEDRKHLFIRRDAGVVEKISLETGKTVAATSPDLEKPTLKARPCASFGILSEYAIPADVLQSMGPSHILFGAATADGSRSLHILSQMDLSPADGLKRKEVPSVEAVGLCTSPFSPYLHLLEPTEDESDVVRILRFRQDGSAAGICTVQGLNPNGVFDPEIFMSEAPGSVGLCLGISESSDWSFIPWPHSAGNVTISPDDIVRHSHQNTGMDGLRQLQLVGDGRLLLSYSADGITQFHHTVEDPNAGPAEDGSPSMKLEPAFIPTDLRGTLIGPRDHKITVMETGRILIYDLCYRNEIPAVADVTMGFQPPPSSIASHEITRALRAIASINPDLTIFGVNISKVLHREEASRKRAEAINALGEDDFPEQDSGDDDDPNALLELSPDGRRLVAHAWDGVWQLFDVERGSLIKEFKHLDQPADGKESIPTLVFSPDSSYLITSFGNETSQLRSALTGESVGSPLYGEDAFFSPDSSWVVAKGQESVRLYSVADGFPVSETIKFDGSELIWQTVDGLVVSIPLEAENQETEASTSIFRKWPSGIASDITNLPELINFASITGGFFVTSHGGFEELSDTALLALRNAFRHGGSVRDLQALPDVRVRDSSLCGVLRVEADQEYARLADITIIPESALRSANHDVKPYKGMILRLPSNCLPPKPRSADLPRFSIRSVMISHEITFGEFVQRYGFTCQLINKLNGLELEPDTVLAKNSELYVPFRNQETSKEELMTAPTPGELKKKSSMHNSHSK